MNDELKQIPAKTIAPGPVSFDLYFKNERGELVLFCKSGYEITPGHKKILETADRTFYVKIEDHKAFLDYSMKRLSSIINDPDIRVKEKVQLLHAAGLRCAEKLFEDPRNGKVAKQSEKIIFGYIDLILDSTEAVAHLFAISSLDNYNYSHSINVATLNLLIGSRIFSNDRNIMWELGMAGLLHDIGKTQVKREILLKEGPLKQIEMLEMKRHPLFSEGIISGHEYGERIRLAGRNHHERWHGGGYPDGLKGEDINIFARITAVADVYDASTSKTSYSSAKESMEALKEMAEDHGHFDPEVFDVLLDVVIGNKILIRNFKESISLGNPVTKPMEDIVPDH